MKISPFIKREHGMTLIELFVVLVVIAVFATIIFCSRSGGMQEARALRIQCVNNLKETGLAFRIWEGDHGNYYPQAVSKTNGGTMEFRTGPYAFRTFQVMSNELYTSKVVFCPQESDSDRFVATNFGNFNNSNISFSSAWMLQKPTR